MKDFTLDEDIELIEMVALYPSIFDAFSSGYRNQVAKDQAWNEIAGQVGRSVVDCKWRWKNIKDTYNKRKRKGKNITGEGNRETWHLAKMLTFLDAVGTKKRKTIKHSQVTSSDIEFVSSATFDDQFQEPYPDETNESAQDTLSTEQEIKPQIDSDTFPPQISPKNTDDVDDDESHRRNTTSTSEVEFETLTEIMKDMNSERTVLINKLLGLQEDHVDVFFKSVAMSVKALPNHLINEAKIKTLELLAELEASVNVKVEVEHSP